MCCDNDTAFGCGCIKLLLILHISFFQWHCDQVLATDARPGIKIVIDSLSVYMNITSRTNTLMPVQLCCREECCGRMLSFLAFLEVRDRIRNVGPCWANRAHTICTTNSSKGIGRT